MAVTQVSIGLNKQDFQDPAWHTSLNSGMDDANTRLTLTNAGDPTGLVAGHWVGQLLWDTTGTELWAVTTATGVAATTVWAKVLDPTVTTSLIDLNVSTNTTVCFKARNTHGGVDLCVQSGVGTARIGQTDSAGVFEELWMQMIRDGNVSLYSNGAEKIRTDSNGARVLGGLLDVSLGTDTLMLMTLRNSIGGMSSRVDNVTGQGRLVQTNTLGIFEDTWVTMGRNGAVDLFFNNVSKLATTVDGMEVTGINIDLNAGADSLTTQFIRNSIGGLALRVNNISGTGQIMQTSSSAGIQDEWVRFTRDAAVDLYYDGTRRVSTSSTGLLVAGTVADLDAAADSVASLRTRNSIGGVDLKVINASGTARIQQTSSAGGSEDIWVDMVRDGAVSAYHNNSVKLATSATGISVTGTLDASDLVASRAVVTGTSGELVTSAGVTAAELEFMAGVTSDVQTQINTKAATADILGKEMVFIPADLIKPTTTSGCSAQTTVEFASGTGDMTALDFDGATLERAYFVTRLPNSWDLTNLEWRYYWTVGATNSGDVVFRLASSFNSDNDAIYGTVTAGSDLVDSSHTVIGDLMISPFQSLTVAAPADGDLIGFRLSRVPTDPSDTLSIDARILGVELRPTLDALNDD